MNTEAKKKRLRRSLDIGAADDCWEWTGHKTADGYGRLKVGERLILSHRLAWEIEGGPLTADLCVLHRCDNRLCCNPAHLFIGTRADNNADRDAKGRGVSLKGERHGRAKLLDTDIPAIRLDKRTNKAIAADYNIHRASVGLIKQRLTWRHIP